MTVVYAVTMFANKPWYDELYTYYYFVSRGPVYAAIHWPVPNNHVGYSVLSACLDIFGNPYIGLRGISFLAAVCNLVLIYVFSLKFFDKYPSLGICALYAGANLVYKLSVQGRGYTLATSCMLAAMICMYDVCCDKADKKSYVGFAMSLTLGLYILPSSLYWVIPVCLTGGLFLLAVKEYKRLGRLILSGVVAAVITVMLYCTIWLAIGANLLSKDANEAYYGLHQVKIILKAPFRSAITGIEYMLATPYIQSIDRAECLKGLAGYITSVLDDCYYGFGVVLVVLLIAAVVWALIYIFRYAKDNRTGLFAGICVAVMPVTVIVMLIIQSVHPYKRVFGFYMFLVSFALVFMLVTLYERLCAAKEGSSILDKTAAGKILGALLLIVCALSFMRPDMRMPLAGKENDIEEALKLTDAKAIDNIFYTDDYQKYVLKFYHDVTPVECMTVEEADFVMVGPEYCDPAYSEPEWPLLYGYDEKVLDYIRSNFTSVAQTERYVIYKRNSVSE